MATSQQSSHAHDVHSMQASAGQTFVLSRSSDLRSLLRMIRPSDPNMTNKIQASHQQQGAGFSGMIDYNPHMLLWETAARSLSRRRICRARCNAFYAKFNMLLLQLGTAADAEKHWRPVLLQPVDGKAVAAGLRLASDELYAHRVRTGVAEEMPRATEAMLQKLREKCPHQEMPPGGLGASPPASIRCCEFLDHASPGGRAYLSYLESAKGLRSSNVQAAVAAAVASAPNAAVLEAAVDTQAAAIDLENERQICEYA